MSHQGHFCWYELNTTDIGAAAAYYTAVVAGWKVGPWGDEPGKMPYAHIESAQGQVGGITYLQEGAKAMGAPPHWLGYVLVDDVDATVAKAQGLGAQLYVAMDIPNTGRIAVIADPQGAVIALYKPVKHDAPHDTSKHGEFNWHELYTSDPEAALAFYSAVFGWDKLGEMDMDAMGKYLLVGLGEKQFGGIMRRPPDMPVSAWGYYIMVDEFDAAFAKATAAGGKLINGPMPVPGGARIVNLVDPQGAHYSLVGV